MKTPVNQRKHFSIKIACLAAIFVLNACSEEARTAARIGTNLAKAKVKGEATLGHDLERWCAVFTKAETTEFKDETAKFTWIMNQTSTALVTVEGIKMYQDLGAAEPGQKWLVVTDAATKAGRTNWDCPAMRKALPPPDAEESGVEG